MAHKRKIGDINSRPGSMFRSDPEVPPELSAAKIIAESIIGDRDLTPTEERRLEELGEPVESWDFPAERDQGVIESAAGGLAVVGAQL